MLVLLIMTMHSFAEASTQAPPTTVFDHPWDTFDMLVASIGSRRRGELGGEQRRHKGPVCNGENTLQSPAQLDFQGHL